MGTGRAVPPPPPPPPPLPLPPPLQRLGLPLDLRPSIPYPSPYLSDTVAAAIPPPAPPLAPPNQSACISSPGESGCASPNYFLVPPILSACFSSPGMCTALRYSSQSSASSSNGNAARSSADSEPRSAVTLSLRKRAAS